jgi:hypothetical protein
VLKVDVHCRSAISRPADMRASKSQHEATR